MNLILDQASKPLILALANSLLMLRRCVSRSPDEAACGVIRVCDQVLPDCAASGSIRATTQRFNGTVRNISFTVKPS